jgi:hypothetical protein
VYPDREVEKQINKNFIPVRLYERERPADFERYKVGWTPVQVFLDADGAELHRIVGFLPVEEMLGQLALSLAKLAFAQGRFKDSEKAFRKLVERYPGTTAAPEALYWVAASAWRRTSNPETLRGGARDLQQQYPESEWTKKASVWLE